MHKRLTRPRDTTQYAIAGPYSLRLASRKVMRSNIDTIHNNFGGNRQNVEKGMRIIYPADPGYKFIQPDQAGAEALVVAHLCKRGRYRELFENKIKPHTYIAFRRFKNQWKKHMDGGIVDELYSTAVSDLAKHPKWKETAALVQSSDNWVNNQRFYYIGKKIVHSSSYGLMGNKFREIVLLDSGGTIVLSREEADASIAEFHTSFPEIRQWHQDTFIAAKKQNQLRNLFGNPLNITWYVDQRDMKDLYAWVPQSTVAIITRIAFVKMQEYIESEHKNWHMLADTHDSYLCEVPDNEQDVSLAITKMREFLEQELVGRDGTKFRMKTGVSVGYNWAPYKEGKNELGLKEL